MTSSSAVGQPKCCDKDKKLDKSCSPDTKENKKFKAHQEQRNKRRKKIRTKKHPHGKPTYAVREMTWKDKQCGNLLFDMNKSPEEMSKDLNKIAKDLKDLKGDLAEQARDIATGAVKDKLAKVAGVAGCEAIGAAIGGVIGFFFGGVGAAPGAAVGAAAGGAICGTAATVDTIIGIPELWSSADWVKEQIGNTKRALKNLKTYQQSIKEIADIKNGPLSADKKTEAIAKIKEPLLKKQETEVNKSPCLKSKRCEMSPYDKSKASVYPRGQGGHKSPMDKMFKLDQKDGCCPGQQAHHIIPKAKVEECPGYDNGKAPTVCLEGGNNNGTHGKLHKRTDVNTDAMVRGKYNKGDTSCNQNAASMKCTIEASAQAMAKEFGCDKKCVKKELNDFYKNLCKEGGLVLKNRNGDVIEITRDENGREGL